MRWFFSFLLLGLLGVVHATSCSGNKLLVILEEVAEKSKYSKYWKDLEERGFKITYESPKNEKVALFELGAKAYDHLLILPPKSKGLGPQLTPKILLDFINAGGNILLTLSSSVPTPSTLVSLLLELDIHLPTDRTALVVDHFNYDTVSASEKHDVLLIPRPDSPRSDVRNILKGDKEEVIAVPRSVGQSLGNSSPLLTPLLRAPRTAYSYNPKDEIEGVEDPFAIGQQLSLVTTMQARNSARFTVIGSSEMLEDAWFNAKVKRSPGLAGEPQVKSKEVKTYNQQFAMEVTGWTFNEIGVLKVGKITHQLNEGNEITELNPKIYRVKNDVKYQIELSEWQWKHWVAYNPEKEDEIQVEFSMLSPFHRLPLKLAYTTPNSTIWATSFKVPDQHGIFNFMVNYKRPFFSNVEEKNTVTVRHFAHDEWPRSWVITGAWPWISGIAATITGWTAFVALWLWSKPVPLQLTTTGKKIN